MADDRENDPKANAALARRSADLLLPEVLAAVRQEGAKIEVNVLLANITEKSQSPEELVKYSEELLDIARKFEDHRVETFKKMSGAVIEAKTKDPDEIEKRANNGMRRRLKGVLAIGGIGSIFGAVAVGLYGGNLLVAVLLGTVGAMCLATLGPLASGESVSSNDMVRMFSAWASAFRPPLKQDKPSADERRKGRK
jgi:hypothetical protein